MKEKKRNLLKMLAEELLLSEDIDRAEFFTAEELEAPVDITRAVVTDLGAELISVLAEFYFMPFENEDMLYFSNVITITDDIRDDEKADLALAVAGLNYHLPCGCFALNDTADMLVYRYTVPILADQDEAAIKKIMLTSVDAAINTADSFESYLMLVLEGNMTPEEMIKMIKGNANNDEA